MRIRKKLKSRRGESLSEVLVAVLIGALAIAMFTIMLSVSARIIQNNRTALSDYCAGNNALLIRQETGNGVKAYPYATAADGKKMTVTMEGVYAGGDTTVVTIPADYYVHNYRGREITVYYKED